MRPECMSGIRLGKFSPVHGGPNGSSAAGDAWLKFCLWSESTDFGLVLLLQMV